MIKGWLRDIPLQYVKRHSLTKPLTCEIMVESDYISVSYLVILKHQSMKSYEPHIYKMCVLTLYIVYDNIYSSIYGKIL